MKNAIITAEQFAILKNAVRKLNTANSYIPKKYEKRAGFDCKAAYLDASLLVRQLEEAFNGPAFNPEA